MKTFQKTLLIWVVFCLFLGLSPLEGDSLYMNPKYSGLYGDYSQKILGNPPVYFQEKLKNILKNKKLSFVQMRVRIWKDYKKLFYFYSFPQDENLAKKFEKLKESMEFSLAFLDEIIAQKISKEIFASFQKSLLYSIDEKWTKSLHSFEEKQHSFPEKFAWIFQFLKSWSVAKKGEAYRAYSNWKQLLKYKKCQAFSLYQKAKQLAILSQAFSNKKWEKDLEKTFQRFQKQYKNHFLADDFYFLMVKENFRRRNFQKAHYLGKIILKKYSRGNLYSKVYEFIFGGRQKFPRSQFFQKSVVPSHLNLYDQWLLGEKHYQRGCRNSLEYKKSIPYYQKIIEKSTLPFLVPQALYKLGKVYKYLWEEEKSCQQNPAKLWLYEFLSKNMFQQFLENYSFHKLSSYVLDNLLEWDQNNPTSYVKYLKEITEFSPDSIVLYNILDLIPSDKIDKVLSSSSSTSSIFDRYSFFRELKNKGTLFLLKKNELSYWGKKNIIRTLLRIEQKYNLYGFGEDIFQKKDLELLQITKGSLFRWLKQSKTQEEKVIVFSQLARYFLILKQKKKAENWLNQARNINLPKLVNLLEWLEGEVLLQKEKWEEGWCKFLALSIISGDVFREPALLRSALIAQKLGKYKYCLKIALQEEYQTDLQYLLDVEIPCNQLEKIWREMPAYSEHKNLLGYSLGTRYLRAGQYYLARKVFKEHLSGGFSWQEQWQYWVKIKLTFIQKLQALDSIIENSDSTDLKIQGLFKKGKIYQNQIFLFYNRPLWKGERVAILRYSTTFGRKEYAQKERAYRRSHNTIERAIEVYKKIYYINPNHPKAPKALYLALQCYERLYDYNGYYRGKDWIALEAWKILQSMAKKFPSNLYTKKAKKVYKKVFPFPKNL